MVEGDIKANSILYSGLSLRDVSSELKLKNAKLSMPNLRMSVLNGSISGPVNFDLGKDPMPGAVSLNLANFSVGPLIKNHTSFPPVITGSAGGKISLSFAGTSAASLQKSAKGDGNIELKDGVLRGVDLVNGLMDQWAKSPAVKKLALQSLGPAINRNIANETKFSELDAQFDLASGRIKIKNAVMDIPEGTVVVSGSVGLDQTVDLKGKIKLSKPITKQVMGDAGKWAEKQSGGAVAASALDLLLDDGSLVLPFHMTGAWPKPSLVFDAKAYSFTVEQNIKKQAPKKIIEQIVGEKKAKEINDEVIKKVDDAIGDEGRKLFESLFPK